jgi:hypothetical protein
MHAFDGFVDRVSRERNVDPMLVRALVTEFLRNLHENIYKDESYHYALLFLLYECGDEAAYHLGGILSQCAGEDRDAGMLVNETVARLGYTLSRYRTVLDKWDVEKKWDEQEKPSTRVQLSNPPRSVLPSSPLRS